MSYFYSEIGLQVTFSTTLQNRKPQACPALRRPLQSAKYDELVGVQKFGPGWALPNLSFRRRKSQASRRRGGEAREAREGKEAREAVRQVTSGEEAAGEAEEGDVQPALPGWGNWLEVNWLAVNWLEVNWPEINWLEINWLEVNCLEVNWLEINWLEVNWLEINWLETILSIDCSVIYFDN